MSFWEAEMHLFVLINIMYKKIKKKKKVNDTISVFGES